MSADTIVRSKQFQPEVLDSDFLEGADADAEIELLAGVLVDKGFEQEAVERFGDVSDLAGKLIGRYYLGNFPIARDYPREHYRNSADNTQRVFVRAAGVMSYRRPTYEGSIEENRHVTQGSYPSYESDYLRDRHRNGAQRNFRTGLIDVREVGSGIGIAEVPIAIVGGGAAGTLTARALIEAGFQDVTVLDKRGEPGGIWNQDNVADGTKNNPFDITYDDIVASSARNVSDPRGTGRSIQEYIHAIARGTGSPIAIDQYNGPVRYEQALVTAIEPGDLQHAVHLKVDGTSQTREYPIVIYAPGNGKPLPLSHAGHMTTTATHKEAGVRWQQQLSPEKLQSLEGKRLVFIGLGNSTAEMVYQIQEYNRVARRPIDYRIITHYPKTMVVEPDRSFADRGQIFRDPTLPELTKLAGDLRHIRDMYSQAEVHDKIVAGVHRWHIDHNKIIVEDRDGISTAIPMDGIYTLTGYGQYPKVLDAMGITCLDDYYGYGAFDYDGEVQSNPGALGRDRLYAGYFAIGPVMKNRYNPNAIVIPGIQGQLGDLITSTVLRATEYAMRHPEEIAERKKGRIAKVAGPVAEFARAPGGVAGSVGRAALAATVSIGDQPSTNY